MGTPFSRALDSEMLRRKSLLNPQNRSRNTPSTVNKVKSVFSISKVPSSSSRPSHSHGSLSTLSTVIHKHSLIVNRSGHGSLSRHLSRGSQHSNFHSSRNTQVSSYPNQYSYSTLSYQAPPHITSGYRTASTGSISTRTLVIEDMGNRLTTSKNRTSNRLEDDDYEDTSLLEKLSVNFDDMESHLEEMRRNDSSQTKAHKFVTAWRNGLSYPHTKKSKVPTDIPIAATSHCKSGITTCSRFCRRHIHTRLGFASDENLLADLVHKDSLERFIEETSRFHATSSIVIKEDLRRKELYDSVHHADSAEKVKDEDKLPNDEDMQITVQFEVPPPFHIDYIPEPNLYEKDVLKMTELHLVTEDHGHVEPMFEITEGHHNKHVVLKKPHVHH